MQPIKAKPNTSVILRPHSLFTHLYWAELKACLSFLAVLLFVSTKKKIESSMRHVLKKTPKPKHLRFAIQSKQHYWATSLHQLQCFQTYTSMLRSSGLLRRESERV